MNTFLNNLLNMLIYSVPAILIAIVLHEVAHAAMSYACGDKMVKAEGRLSLNPLKHLDFVGTVCLLLFHVGWAKPVRVNTAAYKNKKRDFCLVALAGPVMNFLVAFTALLLLYVTARFVPATTAGSYLVTLFYYIAAINVGLGVFNLLPIPPLDGSNVLFALLPAGAEAAVRPYRRYFPLILLLFLYFSPMGNLLTYADTGILNGMWRLIIQLFGVSQAGTI